MRREGAGQWTSPKKVYESTTTCQSEKGKWTSSFSCQCHTKELNSPVTLGLERSSGSVTPPPTRYYSLSLEKGTWKTWEAYGWPAHNFFHNTDIRNGTFSLTSTTHAVPFSAKMKNSEQSIINKPALQNSPCKGAPMVALLLKEGLQSQSLASLDQS